MIERAENKCEEDITPIPETYPRRVNHDVPRAIEIPHLRRASSGLRNAWIGVRSQNMRDVIEDSLIEVGLDPHQDEIHDVTGQVLKEKPLPER